ncbi:MAG TPA: hypothetical protein H9687_00440 [Firmicutes bacterium]|mgnify:CR=1 FL=1|nr:hypothetical protein [Bacillota bacterium]
MSRFSLPAATCVLLLMGYVLFFPDHAMPLLQNGLLLWFQTVVPSLLPFLTGIQLLYGFGAPQALFAPVARLLRQVLRLPEEAIFPLLMGWMAGFPTGAAALNLAVSQKRLSPAFARRLLPLCQMPSPAFLLATVGEGFFGNPKIGQVLLFSLLLPNLAFLIVFPPGYQPLHAFGHSSTLRYPKPSGCSLSEAIEKAASTLLVAGGCMMLLPLFADLLFTLGILPKQPLIRAVVFGLFEMTMGQSALASCALPLSFAVPLAAALLAFGGLSVQMQISAVLTAFRPSLPSYGLVTALRMTLSAATAALLCQIFFLT